MSRFPIGSVLSMGASMNCLALTSHPIRIGIDYGISDRLTIGVGRSSYEKTYDGFIKYKFLRQSTGLKNVPVTAAILGTMAIQTLKWTDPDRENLFQFKTRLYYTVDYRPKIQQCLQSAIFTHLGTPQPGENL